MASLFEAIVLQNLSVLTRGTYAAAACSAAWRPQRFHPGHARSMAGQHSAHVEGAQGRNSGGMKPEDLIKVPENAQYFAALGAVEFGKDEEPEIGRYLGAEKLAWYIDYGRAEEKAASGGKGLVADNAELEEFRSAYQRKKFIPAEFSSPARRSPVLSASMAAPPPPRLSCSDKSGEILCKTYQLSNGNPIQDTIEMFEKLREQVEEHAAPRWKFWA